MVLWPQQFEDFHLTNKCELHFRGSDEQSTPYMTPSIPFLHVKYMFAVFVLGIK